MPTEPVCVEEYRSDLLPHPDTPLSKDREFWLIVSLLTIVYVTSVYFTSQRFVWFDELCTFDIARAPSLHTLWQWVLKFDNNPPTVYLLSRASDAGEEESEPCAPARPSVTRRARRRSNWTT